MVEFLRKSESRGDKIGKLDSHHRIFQFTLICMVLGIRGDADIFKLTAGAPYI